MSQEITHEKAVEIDTQLAELWGKREQLHNRLDAQKKTLARLAGLKGEWGKGQQKGQLVYRETLGEVLDLLQATLQGDMKPWDRRDAEQALAKVAETQTELAAVNEEIEPLEAIFNANPWPRFFLVQNTNGHIHATMQCHSCNWNTRFGWLPNLSGLTEKDAVDAHGTILCSHCFPTAPVEWTLGKQAEVDPNQCPGSGTWDVVGGTRRQTSWSGNGRGQCSHCQAWVGTTSTGKLRKHKKESK